MINWFKIYLELDPYDGHHFLKTVHNNLMSLVKKTNDFSSELLAALVQWPLITRCYYSKHEGVKIEINGQQLSATEILLSNTLTSLMLIFVSGQTVVILRVKVDEVE